MRYEDIKRLRIRKSGRVVEPKYCIGCAFRFASGGNFNGYTCCTLYEKTVRLPKPNRSGECLNKIATRKMPGQLWREQGARRLK